MTLLSPLRPADRQVAARGTGHRAPHVDQVLLRIDLDDLEVLDRDPLSTHPAARAHALEDPRRVGGRTNRARSPVEHRAVGRAAAGEAVPLHHALIALALAGADHVHPLLLGEDRDRHLVARVRVLAGAQIELDQAARRSDAGLAEVTGERLTQLRGLRLDQTDL